MSYLSGQRRGRADHRAIFSGKLGHVGDSTLRAELVGLSDFAWQRLIDRLDGLTDEGYLWEPVPQCWTIRPVQGGAWTWDFTWPEPEPRPVTTIAWRLAHITVNDDRFRRWLGLAPHPRPHRTVPSTARAGLEAAEATKAERHDDLMEVTDANMWERIGVVGGP
jgi:hypothetical protein